MTGIDIPKLLICLRELGDLDFQKQVWLATEGPEVSSFSELVSQTFDDTGLTDVMGAGSLEKMLGPEAAVALKELSDAIDRLDESLSPDTLINHPTMQRVRVHATRAMQHIQKLDDSL